MLFEVLIAARSSGILMAKDKIFIKEISYFFQTPDP